MFFFPTLNCNRVLVLFCFYSGFLNSGVPGYILTKNVNVSMSDRQTVHRDVSSHCFHAVVGLELEFPL